MGMSGARLIYALTSIVSGLGGVMKIVVPQNARFFVEIRAASKYISPY
jgi:hypothetical protein